MDAWSLTDLGNELLDVARTANSGRAARTIHGGHEHALRQTLLALIAGHELAEHESPGEATLQVLRGRVRLIAGEDSWVGGAGDFVVIPPRRHSLQVLEDATVVLSVLSAADGAR